MKTETLKNIGRTRILQIALVSAFAVFAASCSKEDIRPDGPELETADDIVQVLASFGEPDYFNIEEDPSKFDPKANPTFGTLNSALARAGLAGLVSRNQMTIFAPTDVAFAQLGLTPKNIASVPNLQEILLYHVFNGMIYSNQLTNGFFETAGGSFVEINALNPSINDANIFIADIKARNGVIHVIDKVLFPPTLNLVELALSLDPEFSILVQAVIKAGLTDVLASGGPFTVFAPSNAAFIALLGEQGFASLDDIPVDLLTKVLLYHVVDGRAFSSDLSSGSVTTLNGTFELSLETLGITDANGREASLVPGLLNVQATNGVVHVIDRVILPDLSK
jgi:transforming growth factor-beta-induced protein